MRGIRVRLDRYGSFVNLFDRAASAALRQQVAEGFKDAFLRLGIDGEADQFLIFGALL